MSEYGDFPGVVTAESGELNTPKQFEGQSYEVSGSGAIPLQDCFALMIELQNEDEYGFPQTHWEFIGIAEP